MSGIPLSLVNGFGTMGLRKRFGGERWWTLNMKVHGGGWYSSEPIGTYRMGL